jgi:carnitine-CoA ligase
MMSRQDASSTVLPATTCVVRYALERHAQERGEATYAVFDAGGAWTFAGLLREVRKVAAGLQSIGVGQGDRVLVMMPNGAPGLLALFAANYIGAAFVPINTAYRGRLLQHVVIDSSAVVAVVHPKLLDRLLEVDPGELKTVVVAEERSSRSIGALQVVGLGALYDAGSAPQPLARDVCPWDLQSIIYTSGTTGQAKGVLSSYMHSFSACNPDVWSSTRPDDRHLLHMPIFHIGGAFVASMALCVGASVAVVEGFKTDTFWVTVRQLEVTAVFLLGAMATFLLKQPHHGDDRNHPLRMVIIVPLGHSGPPFRNRFGVDVYTLYNMTEISTPLVSGANPAKPNVCGRPRAGVEVRIVDEHDCPVPAGQAGQLIVRTEAPWAMSHGYNRNMEATVAAWRNGWFHTGDVFMVDEEGDYFFVDRLKDTIRRRGENISSYELEVELLSHPDIREAAAIPVPSEVSEDEVMVVVAAVAGRVLDAAGILAYLTPRLPHFMLPRFIRIVDDLPKTPTAKVQKHILRDQGRTPDTWDRERAGIVVRREII